jgi:HPt (histidine-containing phosphotransfer) domain-containing protein
LTAINWPEALSAVGGDRELLQQLIAAFLHESPVLMAGLERAAVQGDRAELQRQAHSLKSSIRFFGVESATALAGRLEELGGEGGFDAAPPLVTELKAELKELQYALTSGPPE